MSNTSENQELLKFMKSWNGMIVDSYPVKTDASMTTTDPCFNNGPLICASKFYEDLLDMKSDRIPVDKILLRDILDGLESGLESINEELIKHDAALGRTTRKNQNYAELLEDEIRKIKTTIEKVKKLV